MERDEFSIDGSTVRAGPSLTMAVDPDDEDQCFAIPSSFFMPSFDIASLDVLSLDMASLDMVSFAIESFFMASFDIESSFFMASSLPILS
jgi:hypothetical protein